jgi:hypothetical protein
MSLANLVQSLKAVSQPSRQTATRWVHEGAFANDTWLFLQRNNSQRPLLCLESHRKHMPQSVDFVNEEMRVQQFLDCSVGTSVAIA